MAIIIMLDLNIAQKFEIEMELLDRLSQVDHATAGMIVVLFIFKILLRYRYGAESPETMPLCRHVGKNRSFGLFFLMGLLIVSQLL